MGTLQPPNRYRACILPHGFPQSLSGSETDVSTSNENLSNEEKYVIRHTARQEPQGQENLQSSNRSSLRDSLPSNRSSLDVSSSSYNTLIIHSAGDEPWTGRNSGTTDVNPPSYLSHQSPSLFHDPKLSPVQKRNSASPSPSITGTGVQEITEIPDDYLSQSSVLKHLAKEVKAPNAIAKENVENMDSKLSLKDSNLKYDYENRPPPPEYSKWEKSSHQSGAHKNKSEKYSLSKSQPDLSKVGLGKMGGDLMAFKKGVTTPRPKTKGREEYESNKDEGDNWPSIDSLMKENTSLKIELKNCYQRVAKTQKFEQEVLKVHKAHEELVQTCDKRERLEKAARVRLQNECKRLQEINRELQSQVNFLSNQILSRTTAPDTSGCDSLRRELNKRELLITQLITQNKELVAAKERQEIELAAQRVTLQEQRNHIDILEAALTNAQRNVVRLEEESHKKQVYVERVIQLQRALSSLQLASDKREQTERNLRLQLEMELQRSKNANCDEHNSAMNSHINLQIDSISELKRRLRDREEKIISLGGECSKWEQRYLEESGLRQAAIDAASIPKDAKIAALEKTSHETEKIITEARNEKIRHMDEVHAAQKKVADLESRLKDLESKLAERDAMIRVLQKHTYDKDVSSMLGRSPHHTPHPSLGGADIDHVLGTTVSREELVSSVLTSSTGFGSNSYAGSDSSYHMPSYSKYESNKSFDSTKQTLDNQLKEIDSQLDSQLLSKRGLCCFPGFTNPVTAQRKGKIPKPLLAGVSAGTGGGLFETGTSFLLPPASRHESGEMLLLEKQGRTSQQQRMQENNGQTPNSDSPSANNPDNLPPSSLPRPPRSSSVHRSGLPRRLGEYNRLADAELPQRKKSDGGDSLSSNTSRGSPSRSHIPPPARKLGEYGRLSESGGSSASLRKPSTRMRVGSTGERDSTSTLSDNSASSLPPPSKVKLYGATTRRGSSLGRDSKSSTDSNASKYRIQF